MIKDYLSRKLLRKNGRAVADGYHRAAGAGMLDGATTGRTSSSQPNIMNAPRPLNARHARELFAQKVQLGNPNFARRLVGVLNELGFHLAIETHGKQPLKKIFVTTKEGARWWELYWVLALRKVEPSPVRRNHLARRVGILFGGIEGIDTIASLAANVETAFTSLLEEHACPP